MMKYTLSYDSSVTKDFKKIDKMHQAIILDQLDEFIANFSLEFEAEMMKLQKIKALKGEWLGYYRYRVRTYRVIYKKYDDKLVIFVVRVAHRKEVY